MIKRFFFFLYAKLVKPRSKDEDLARREFILNVVALISIVLLLLLNLFALYFFLFSDSYSGLPLIVLPGVLGLFLFFYCLSRKGFLQLASTLLILTYFLGNIYGAYKWGVDLPMILLSYSLVIVMTSILFSAATALKISGISVLIIISFSYLEHVNIIFPNKDWRYGTLRINDGIEYGFILLFITIVSWLSNREIEYSFKRAKASEAALIEERNQLEVKVEKRTEELKQLQFQRIMGLHRLAESGRMATGLFHDLMNPLTALAFSIEQISEAASTPKRVLQTHLDQALAASRRISDLFTSIQKYNSETEQEEEFAVAEELVRIAILLNYKARKANKKIVISSYNSPTIVGRLPDFYQIVHNVLCRLIEIPNHQERDTEKIDISFNQSGAGLIITFTIALPNNLEEIKAWPENLLSTSHNESSTMIGLSIAKQLIKQSFEGNIRASSNNKLLKITLEFGINKLPQPLDATEKNH